MFSTRSRKLQKDIPWEPQGFARVGEGLEKCVSGKLTIRKQNIFY